MVKTDSLVANGRAKEGWSSFKASLSENYYFLNVEYFAQCRKFFLREHL